MHYVFYVTDHQLDIFGFEGAKAKFHERISWPQLDAYLASFAHDVEISLILDVVDEDLQVEYMPALLPWEKQTLHKRLEEKGRQKGVGYQRLLWSGQKQLNEEGRKDEMLVSAQVYPSKQLTQLMSWLTENNMLVTGLYSSAFLLQTFFNGRIKHQLKLTRTQLKAPLLLIARMTEKHYRQCFFYQGQLRLTRIVELDSTLTDEISIIEFLAQEAKLATRFIYNQKVIAQGDPINYVVLDNVDESLLSHYSPSFEAAGAVSAKWTDENFFDVVDLVEHVTMERADLCFGGALLAELINRRRWLPSFYRDGYVDKINIFRYAGLALKAVSLVLFIWLVLAMINSGLQRVFLQQKQQYYQQVALAFELKKGDLIRIFDSKIKPSDMQSTVDFSDKAQSIQQLQSMGIDIKTLAAIIAEHSFIKVESIRWQAAEKLDDNVFNVRLRGIVFPFDGQYEPIMQAMQRFELSLEQHPQIQGLKVSQKPFNQDATQSLSILTSTPRALPFSLEFQMQSNLAEKVE